MLTSTLHNEELDLFPIEDCLVQEYSMDYSSADNSPTSSEEDDKFLPKSSCTWDIMNVDLDILTLLSQYFHHPMIYNHEDLCPDIRVVTLRFAEVLSIGHRVHVLDPSGPIQWE